MAFKPKKDIRKFISLIEKGIKELPLTDKEMTRFWISPHEAIETIFYTFKTMKGGEIIVEGTPEDVARHASSYTAKYLKQALN